MVSFDRYMSIGMQRCAPTGPGTQEERQRVFGELADGWNRNSDVIRELSESQLRDRLRCP